MKWQEHSQISQLAGSRSAALSDFERAGEQGSGVNPPAVAVVQCALAP